MKRALVWIGSGLVFVVVAFIATVFLTKTTVRDAPSTVPGYVASYVPAAHRSAELPVHIWYPSTDTKVPDLIGQNALFYGTYAVTGGAASDADPLPVVVVSHGSGGNMPRLGWLAVHLANAGFLVIGTNHPGATSRDSDPHLMTSTWLRAADLSALLDFLETAPDGVPKADLSRVAALGFSLGAPAAMRVAGLRYDKEQFVSYCATNPKQADCAWTAKAGVDHSSLDAALYGRDDRDPRVAALIAVDPAQTLALTGQSAQALALPTLLVNLGDEDLPLSIDGSSLAQEISQARYHTVAGPHSHFSFLAECAGLGKIVMFNAGPENICAERGAKPRANIHAEVGSLITEFLQDVLGGS